MRRLLKLKKQTDKKVENIITTFKEILKDKDASRILFERNKSLFTYQIVVDDDVSEAEELYKICEEIDIFNFETAEKNSVVNLFNLFNSLTKNNFYITHILVLSKSALGTWSGVDSILGARILECKELPEGTALFCASDNKTGDIVDIKKVIKMELK